MSSLLSYTLNQKKELLYYGYFRINYDSSFPKDLINSCMKWYQEIDYFDTIGHDTVASQDKRTITKSRSSQKCSYGFYYFPSNGNQIVTWTIKINKVCLHKNEHMA